jgi:PHP family Zn ribbon phosphoesterase
MKTLRTHTGIFSCLHCYTEFDLFAETNLKCDTCGGILVQGKLEELVEEDGDGADPQEP